MSRWLAFACLFAVAPLLFAQGSREETPDHFELRPFERIEFAQPGLVGRDAQVIAIGNGKSALGIYVFDPLGNCVAFDDEPSPAVDDRIVGWTSARTGLYGVQIRNLGFAFNTVDAAAK